MGKPRLRAPAFPAIPRESLDAEKQVDKKYQQTNEHTNRQTRNTDPLVDVLFLLFLHMTQGCIFAEGFDKRTVDSFLEHVKRYKQKKGGRNADIFFVKR